MSHNPVRTVPRGLGLNQALLVRNAVQIHADHVTCQSRLLAHAADLAHVRFPVNSFSRLSMELDQPIRCPSRLSGDSNPVCVSRSRVLVPSGRNSTVSTVTGVVPLPTCHACVYTSRVGRTISRYIPNASRVLPSSARIMTRQSPPTRRSSSPPSIEIPGGDDHWLRSSGCVHAANTRSGGAAISRSSFNVNVSAWVVIVFSPSGKIR